MRNNLMKLPELNCLTPNEHTTFCKLVEEISECNTAIADLRDYESKHTTNYLLLSDSEVQDIREKYKYQLQEVMGEIMDIAQVCASQLFVFEANNISVQQLFMEYAEEFNLNSSHIVFQVEQKCRYVHFEANEDLPLQDTMNRIILSMGTIAQLGKFRGDNGEVPTIDKDTSNRKYVYELFKVIQNCFNLLYSLEEKYNIQIEPLFDNHVEKLVRKGYCSI